jgi:hypothetical protein
MELSARLSNGFLLMTDRGPRSPSEGAQVTKWVLFLEDRFAIETMHDAPDRECADNSDQRVNMAARGVTQALMKQPEGVRVCGPRMPAYGPPGTTPVGPSGEDAEL